MSAYKYELTREWSDTRAEWQYKLTEKIDDLNMRAFIGDMGWALRQSKHYKIPMPEERKETNE